MPCSFVKFCKRNELLMGDVHRRILRVGDPSHESQLLWHELIAALHVGDTAKVKLDVVLLLLGLEEIEQRP